MDWRCIPPLPILLLRLLDVGLRGASLVGDLCQLPLQATTHLPVCLRERFISAMAPGSILDNSEPEDLVFACGEVADLLDVLVTRSVPFRQASTPSARNWGAYSNASENWVDASM